MPAVNREKALKLIRAAFRTASQNDTALHAIRDCLVVSQWGIEDVDLWFVVELNNGKIRFREGRVDYAGITFRYRHAADFHFHLLGEASKEVKWWIGYQCFGNRGLQRYTSPVFDAVRQAYRDLVATGPHDRPEQKKAPIPSPPKKGEKSKKRLKRKPSK